MPEILDQPASSQPYFSLCLNVHILKNDLTIPFTYLLQKTRQLNLDETLSPGVSSSPDIFIEHERGRGDSRR